MLVLILLAFGSARVTHSGAHAAEICDKARVTADERGTIPAEVCAINTESRAFRHLAETLIAARFTLFRTPHTSVHARLILMSHERILLLMATTERI